MKKIIIIIGFLLCSKVYAISSVSIDGESLIPEYDPSIMVYNFYTNKDNAHIKIDDDEYELELKDDYNEYVFDKYKIRIFKNYNKNNEEEVYLKSLNIIGYDINFDKDIHEYSINIDDEDSLKIEYEVSNENAYVSVSGNGNFLMSDNIITINVNNETEYVVHALKTMNVSLINNDTFDGYIIKKEIAKYLVITISCILVFLFYYLMFKKNHFYI